MLDNELYGIEDWLRLVDPAFGKPQGAAWSPARCTRLLRQLKGYGARARQNWALALFADRHQESLRRYFIFHQQLIGEALTRLSRSGEKDVQRPEPYQVLIRNACTHLCGLLDLLFTLYSDYIDKKLTAPGFYRQLQGRQDLAGWQQLDDRWQREGLDPSLKSLFKEFFTESFDDVPGREISYQRFLYARELNRSLDRLTIMNAEPDPVKVVTLLLVRNNFNHLGFFGWYVDDFQSSSAGVDLITRMNTCLELKKEMVLFLEHDVPAYDPAWPSLAHLLYHWLQEEIQSLQFRLQQQGTSSAPAAPAKIALNLPVNYLACLLQLIYDGDWTRNQSLTDLFKFVATHFESKKATDISYKSLSKEYYTVSQKTAAMVKDLLQGMIVRINRQYFPLWIVISAAVLWR